MEGQPEPEDDLLRRVLIERRAPQTWKGIVGCVLVSALALVLVIVNLGGFAELVAAGVFAIGTFQALSGMLRKAWLALGGTDQPLRSYLKRRLGG